MSRAMEDEFDDVETRLEQLSGTRLNTQELGSRLHAIALSLLIPPPDSRRQTSECISPMGKGELGDCRTRDLSNDQ
jgi:hypothetical protein